MSENPYNELLHTRRDALAMAYRGLIAPGCAIPAAGFAPAPTARAAVNAMKHVAYRFPTGVQFQLIPSFQIRRYVYEFQANIPAGTHQIQLWQGKPFGSTGVLLFQAVSSATDPLHVYLPLSGNDSQFHFAVDAGQPFVMLMGGAAAFVDGFLRYRHGRQQGQDPDAKEIGADA